MHGATAEEQAQLITAGVHKKVKDYYNKFHGNNKIVLGLHQYLFTSRPLNQLLKSAIDTLSAWARSVEEAFQVVLRRSNKSARSRALDGN
jgi:hypothetical protein